MHPRRIRHIIWLAIRLAAAIYTQISDVEVEINGLLTYDREIEKMDAEVVGNANRKLYEVSP